MSPHPAVPEGGEPTSWSSDGSVAFAKPSESRSCAAPAPAQPTPEEAARAGAAAARHGLRGARAVGDGGELHLRGGNKKKDFKT